MRPINHSSSYLINLMLLLAGSAVVSERSSDWCSVRRVGQEVLSLTHRVLHLCSNSFNEDQPMVCYASLFLDSKQNYLGSTLQ